MECSSPIFKIAKLEEQNENLLESLKNMCDMWEDVAVILKPLVNEERYLKAKQLVSEATKIE